MAEISIIGPRASGKTTFLTCLVGYQKLVSEISGLKITPFRNARKLEEHFEILLGNQRRVPPTSLKSSFEDEPYYELEIKIPAFKGLIKTNISLDVKDIGGELFDALEKGKSLSNYLESLCETPAWMVVLTDWEPGEDDRMYRSLQRLLDQLSYKNESQTQNNKLRLAMVINKCERGELWPCRYEPEQDLFKVRLPQTTRLLKDYFNPTKLLKDYFNYANLIERFKPRLKFFACSSFGVMDDRTNSFNPRPNYYLSEAGQSSEYGAVVRDKYKWKPFGLLNPIYWLATGKTLYDPKL